MIDLLYPLFATARSNLKSQRELALENLASRQQLAILHRKGFRLYWTWKSRNRGGRPPIDREIRTLIRRIASKNPTWGAPRIHGELLRLGFELGEATVSRYMPLRRKPPSQTRRTFLRNRTKDLISIDFFVVPTATFRILYVFLVLEHERRSTSSGTETRSMARTSLVECVRWESSRSSPRHGPHGRIRTASA